jgi:predicted dienelactone hydrolase
VILTSSGWTRRRRNIAIGSGVLIVVASIGLVSAQGLRWQFVPLAGAAVLAILVQAARRKRVVIPGTAGVLILALCGGAALWAFPRVHFPEPSGPYAVGTWTAHWVDEARGEKATANTHDHRSVVVQAWYPARTSPEQERAHYLGRTQAEADAVARGVAHQFGAPAFLFDDAADARTSSVADARPAGGEKEFPVVLFSPGLGGVRTQNTAWAQDLASHGYVVVAIDHPYDSAAVVVDGAVITSRLQPTGNDEDDRRLADESASIRAADLRFVLSRLQHVDGVRFRSPFASTMDAGRVGVAGHSLGGAAAVSAAQQDDRFDAVIDLDGFPRNLIDRAFPQPVLALVADDAAADRAYRERLDRVLRSSESPSFELQIARSSHLTFTDAPLFLPPLPSLIGGLSRAEGPRITADASRAFLDAALKGSGTDVSTRLAELGAVRTFGDR